MTRWSRWLAVAAAAVVLLGGGAVVVSKLFLNHVENAVPRADLFGDATPTPSTGASATPTPTPSPTPEPGADLVGPLNILIVGVDTRISVPNWVPHADAVMILHISKDLSHGYLTSLPRDLVVDIPAFAPSRYGGGRSKLTHAITFGSRVPGTAKPNPAQGFQLLAKAVSGYTGIPRFDAGGILTFGGLQNLVDAVGGIDLYVDQKVVSIHKAPDGKHRPECSSCSHGYSGPAATYNVGTQHLVGWQALDYARQRYISGGDYARQRHQRQLIKAIVGQVLGHGLLQNPATINNIVNALGDALIFDGRGHGVVDFAFALRHITGDTLTLVGLPGGGVYGSGGYQGERLDAVANAYFAAVRQDTVQSFVTAHPALLNREP